MDNTLLTYLILNLLNPVQWGHVKKTASIRFIKTSHNGIYITITVFFPIPK